MLFIILLVVWIMIGINLWIQQSNPSFEVTTLETTPDPTLEPTPEPTPEPTSEPTTEVLRQDLTEDEYNLLLRLVYAEAGNTTYDAQAGIASVVLNRMELPMQFRDTLTDVIFQPGQFEPAQNGEIYTGDELVTMQMVEEVPSVKEAVDAALRGYDPTKAPLMAMGEPMGALFYYQEEALDPYQLSLRANIIHKIKLGTETFYTSWN